MQKNQADLFGVCPYLTAQRVLTGKWALIIIHQLSHGPVRFNELQRRVPDITQATLAKQLKTLESDGLIVRTLYPQVPPKVEYTLSAIGEQFRPVLEQVEIWGKAYIEYLSGRPPQAQ